jgi:hypothetical protein
VRQVLGEEHPDTQMMMGRLTDAARAAGMTPGSLSPSPSPAPAPEPVTATVSGLVSAAELNDCSAEVLSWVEAKGRYQCRVSKRDGSTSSVAIKPANLLLPVGTAVIVCGVTGAPELSGKAGVTREFSAEKGRYIVKVEGRPKAAALQPHNIMVQM